MNKKITRMEKLIFVIGALLLFALLLPAKVYASETFTSGYSQDTFEDEDGFDSGEANCVCQSASGYIWVGTDNGLYRYDGSVFTLFAMDSESDGSKYAINCIYSTSDDVLYVGTENSGLFVYDEGSFHMVSATYDMGISTINGIYESDSHVLYLATTSGIYSMENGDIKSITEDVIGSANIGNISGYGDKIYATANNDQIITVDADGVVTSVSKQDYGVDDINSLYVDSSGNRYYGSVGYSVLKIAPSGAFKRISTGNLHGINKIYSDGTKIWILADDGVGYLGKKNKVVTVSSLEFNESMSDMIIDFEGNYWFTSYRKGLLFLERSKFENVTMKYGIGDSIVNCVTGYNNSLFIGTDEGLFIVSSDGKVNDIEDDELITMLDGISIRDLYVDSNNYLWIATYKIYGVIRLDTNWEYKTFNRGDSGLVSNAINCVTELSAGKIAVGTESGISIIEGDEVTKSITRWDDLTNPDVICLYQADNGYIYAGTNGSGIYVVDKAYNVSPMELEDGQKMSVVSCIIKGSNGLWIGTDSGLYYQEETLRQVTSVDTANSVYDMILDSQGYLWLFGSKGMYRYFESDILSSTTPEYSIYTKNDGMASGITERSSNYIVGDSVAYVCCDEGLSKIDISSEYTNEVAPKVRISSVEVDGKEYLFSELDGHIELPKDTNRITIRFSVLSYVNRSNISVDYYLDGFENEKRTLTGNDEMEVEYTNLEGGEYNFVLSASNSDGVECDQTMSFSISKELSFFETKTSRMLIALVIFFIVVFVIVVARIIMKFIIRKNQEVEELSKKSFKAEKSNRAKNDYVNYLNNEIRAPLNNIISLSEMAMRGCESSESEDYQNYSSMYTAGKEILDMSDGISRLSNLQDDIIEPERNDYYVSDVIDELSHEFSGMINRDLVELKVSIEDKIPNGLVGDAGILKEILINIFSWAASTTKEGYISIDVDWREDNPKNENNAKNRESKAYREKLYEEENESLAELTGAYDGDLGDIFLDFKISDTGLGVKEERIDNFFDIDDSYERSDIGMFKVSLGLAIARELVRMLGGDVSVESIYGAGTTVRFSVRQSVFDYSYVNYNERKRREMARRDSNSHLCLPDVKILIVDDSEIALQVEKALFETYEITCDVATSGFDALDKIMVNHYDMAFVSTVLPVMDGIDTVREIRNLEGEEFKKMPIVALSANLVDTSREEILTSGFNELIVKPIELDQAEAMLRSFISQDKIKEKDNDITELEGENKFIEDAEILSGFVNVEEAIKVMGGSFKIFNTFISNYKEEYQTEVQLLKSYVDEDVRRYKNIIHDIKSSSSNIGAYGVERKAANLESAINIGNQQYVRDNTRDFVAMMNDFFKRIDVYMARISHVELPDKKETRDKINKGKLKELRAFLRQNEITPAKEILADIDRYEYGDIDMEFLAALKDFVSSGDYEASSEMIDQYLNSI